MLFMLRVLHINDHPIGSQGGAEVLMERTLVLLRRAGVIVDVFSAGDLTKFPLTPWRYIDNGVARRALSAKLRAFRPDIVHLHNFYHVLSPGILAELGEFRKSRPLRVVMTAHDYHLVCPNSGLTWFGDGPPHVHAADGTRLSSLGYLLSRRWDRRGWAHSLLKCAQHWWNYRWHGRQQVIDVVICPSRFAAELLSRAGRPTVWLPHPCPAAPPAPRQRAERLAFVFAGRLAAEKGLAELLEIWPSDVPAEWTIVGSGPEEERCRRILSSKGLAARAAFLGHLPHDRALAAIAASHVLVLPSRCPESYGLTLVEALSAGTNLLVANHGAIAEMVAAAGVGFVFELDDEAGLRRQVEAIQESHRVRTLNDFEVRDFLNGRSEDAYLSRLLEIYRDDANRLAAAA
jgi:glycosyltransferase involved in cell wall biosynthesis